MKNFFLSPELVAAAVLMGFIALLLSAPSHSQWRTRHHCVNIGRAESSYRPLRINGNNVEYTRSETHLYECDNGLRRM